MYSRLKRIQKQIDKFALSSYDQQIVDCMNTIGCGKVSQKRKEHIHRIA